MNIFKRKKSIMREDANKGNRMQDNSGGGYGGNGGGKKNDNDNGGDNKEQRRGPNIMIFIIVTFIALLVISYFVSRSSSKSEEITYDQFLTMVSENKVESISIEADRVIITEKAKGDSKFDIGKSYFTGLAEDSTTLTGRMLDSGVEVSSKVESGSNLIINILLTYVLPLVILWVALGFIFNRIGRSGGFGFGVGRSNAKMYEGKETGITFKDVAGEDEAKESLVEIVDFLHNPDKYSKIGAKIPKGGLLVGPPGTGKTLLAKAVAGEAGVPFFSLAGSDFVELYVGVGASRVRDLFKEAEKNAPCIIFIDEIDAIGRSRDSKFGGNDEREQTLNQLLSEMDGFDAKKGIILLAATNRPEVLDKALLRPGRFDRRIIVEEPDLKGRVEILKVHAKDVLLDQTVDLDEIALATVGAVGADLANMINEAAILAVKRGREYVSQKDMLDAVELVSMGKEKKDRILSKKERQIVSYHETGHALISALQKNTEPVQKITIIPRTMGTLGYVLSYPEEEKFMQTEKELRAELVSILGGRAAEDIVFDTVTTGAANDIEKATRIARAMITRFGMSKKFGLMQIESVDNPYLDRSTTLNCADETAAMVDEEVMKLIKESYKEAKRLLKDNREILDKIAEYLIEKETITGHEFMEIYCKEKGIPVPEKGRGEESLAKMRREKEAEGQENEGTTEETKSEKESSEDDTPHLDYQEIKPAPVMPPVPAAPEDFPTADTVKSDASKEDNDSEDDDDDDNDNDEMDFAAELRKRAFREKSDDDGNS
jgi:cell division protease FtsH